MLRSLVVALCVAFFAVPIVTAQSTTAKTVGVPISLDFPNVPTNSQGFPMVGNIVAPTEWSSSSAPYSGGAFVTRNGLTCVALQYNLSTDPATDTAHWKCSVGAAQVGVAGGVAPLDSTGKVPAANLPTGNGGGPTYDTQTFSRAPMANWLAALHDCNNRVVNLVGLTDFTEWPRSTTVPARQIQTTAI